MLLAHIHDPHYQPCVAVCSFTCRGEVSDLFPKGQGNSEPPELYFVFCAKPVTRWRNLITLSADRPLSQRHTP